MNKTDKTWLSKEIDTIQDESIELVESLSCFNEGKNHQKDCWSRAIYIQDELYSLLQKLKK
tara:strand:+ start:870 stop:1052 length:183 start_codon:yes stop_codon:yes gene_type:complete